MGTGPAILSPPFCCCCCSGCTTSVWAATLGLGKPREDVGTLELGTRMWVTVAAGVSRDGESRSWERGREGEEEEEEEEREEEVEEGGVGSLLLLIC